MGSLYLPDIYFVADVEGRLGGAWRSRGGRQGPDLASWVARGRWRCRRRDFGRALELQLGVVISFRFRAFRYALVVAE